MPAISSSVPPRGRRTRKSSSDSGRTTHSLPRVRTRDPIAKALAILAPASEHGRILSDERRPFLVMAEAQHDVAEVFHRAGLLSITRLPLREVMRWSVHVDHGRLPGVEEVTARSSFREELRRVGWEAMVA